MDFELNEIFADFADNLQKSSEELSSQEFVSAVPQYDLLPNNTNETIDVERPFFLENVLYSDAQVVPDSEKDIQEKYDIPQDLADILDMAHPDPVYVADDTYDGGLVENLDEVREKHLSVVNKMPSGNHIHLANLVTDLVKMANDLEDANADLKVIGAVDSVLENIKRATDPLADSLVSEAFAWVPVMIGAAVLGGSITGIAWQSLLGMQNGLITDANDLYNYVDDLPGSYPNMEQATQIVASAGRVRELAQVAVERAGQRMIDNEYHNMLNRIDRELLFINSALALLKSQTDDGWNPIRFEPTKQAIKRMSESVKQARDGAYQAAQSAQQGGAEKAVRPAEIDVSEEPEGLAGRPDAVVPPAPKSEQEIRKIQQYINERFKTIHGSTVLSKSIPVTGKIAPNNEDDPTWAAMRAIASFTRDQFASGPEALAEVTPTNLAKLNLTGWERFFEGHKNAQKIMLAGSGIDTEPVEY